MTAASAIDRFRRGGLADRLRIGARTLAAGAVAGLVLFHAVLLWQRIADLSLLEPGVWMRWAATLVVLAGWWRLHRMGLPLLRGRRALALCLLALLLHVHVPFAPAAPALDMPAPSSLLLILPATLSLSGGAAAAAGLAVLAAVLLASTPTIGSGRVDSRPVAAARAGVIPALACRPPPA